MVISFFNTRLQNQTVSAGVHAIEKISGRTYFFVIQIDKVAAHAAGIYRLELQQFIYPILFAVTEAIHDIYIIPNVQVMKDAPTQIIMDPIIPCIPARRKLVAVFEMFDIYPGFPRGWLITCRKRSLPK